MIRRPLNERFAGKVLDGVKISTIREKEWPVCKPIMLFRWEGKPYRSKQVEIAPVVVSMAFTVVIRRDFYDVMSYEPEGLFPDGKRPLWECEGFDSQADMDDWFRPLTPTQSGIFRSLMVFHLYTPPAP